MAPARRGSCGWLPALLLADSGSITVLGKNAGTQSLQVQGSIGYMPQRFGLYEGLTVQENLDLYADLQGVPLPDRGDRYRELLQMAELAPFTPAPGRKALRGNEAEAGAGLQPGAPAGPSTAR
jgi:ABC-type multidrug transport system ATPase subunit